MQAPALVGTVLDGKFQIAKALASGASGDVYEALHLALGSRVAVKVLRPGIPETAHIRRKRFLREARVAAGMRSDHVVRVFDVVAPEQGHAYIVMELLHGETLAERLRRVGALPVGEAVAFVLQAAKPLGEMHEAGIVHRDVKPSNVFLARDADGKERIKLLDFGVAAFQQPVPRGESSLTLSEAIVGTPRYMAPEQVMSSKQVDARADVWALGVTLYELLSGVTPFQGTTVLAVLNQIEHQEPRRLTELRPDVPAEIASLVHRCLAKDPAARPADARALAEALSAPPDTLPPSVFAPRHVGRRWAAVAAGAGLAVVVVAGITGVALRRATDTGEPASVASPVTEGSAVEPAQTPAPSPTVGAAAVQRPASPVTVEPPSSVPPVAATTSSRPAAAQRRNIAPPPPRATPRPRSAVRSSVDDDRIE
jgi:serine/threonine-protein kinase